MDTITLFKSDGSWQSRDTDPKVKELFGTDTIPTCYTDQASAVMVLAHIKRLNPAKRVTLTAKNGEVEA